MPSVKVRENEPFEFALRRFKRTCEKAGVLAEVRRREFYEKPTQERKRKAAAAVTERVLADLEKKGQPARAVHKLMVELAAKHAATSKNFWK